jgi:hypothetical protein
VRCPCDAPLVMPSAPLCAPDCDNFLHGFKGAPSGRARPSGPGRVRTRKRESIEGWCELAQGPSQSRGGSAGTSPTPGWAACRALTGGSPPGAAPPPGQHARTRRQAVPAVTLPDDRDREN